MLESSRFPSELDTNCFLSLGGRFCVFYTHFTCLQPLWIFLSHPEAFVWGFSVSPHCNIFDWLFWMFLLVRLYVSVVAFVSLEVFPLLIVIQLFFVISVCGLSNLGFFVVVQLFKCLFYPFLSSFYFFLRIHFYCLLLLSCFCIFVANS